MEIITSKTVNKTNLLSFDSATAMYDFAKNYVLNNRNEELNRFWNQVLCVPSKITEHFFMREYLWCAYVSGFNAARISSIYNKLLEVHNIEFMQQYIPITNENIISDFTSVYTIFGNKNKANAIQRVRRLILSNGWSQFYKSYVDGADPEKLRNLPFLGPALSKHIARNLGNQNVCKPDVHLKRLAEQYGYKTAEDLCMAIDSSPIGYTDLILWLASVDHGTLNK